MGAKQSNPVFDGRTRAYSSSDLPSGNPNASEGIAGFRYTNGPDGPRIRYTGGGGGGGGSSGVGLDIPGSGRSGSHALNQSLDGTDGESDLPAGGHRLLIGSLPAHLSPRMLGGFHCPVCSKYVASDEMEKHLLSCFSKTRLAYNSYMSLYCCLCQMKACELNTRLSWYLTRVLPFKEVCGLKHFQDILSKDSGECTICLEELDQGDTIARLPCLCIYHKGCIDEWFEVNRSCPEHPFE